MPAVDTTIDPTACLDLMVAGFERATVRAGTTIERCIRVGDETVRLRFAGPALLEVIEPALSHRLIEPVERADFTVDLWDSASTGEPLSPLIEHLHSSIQSDPYRYLTPRHEIIGMSNERVPAACDVWSGVMSMFDRETDRGVYWVADASNVPYFERGAPMRAMLSWWLADRGYQSVHAGGVGFADGGVLLTGKSGSGKSTTALSCLDSPLSYIGDDYCLFRLDDPPTAFSLYNTAKLNGLVDIQRQPRFLPFVENPERDGDDKLLMFLARHLETKLLPSFPVRAVVLPMVVADGVTDVVEIAGAEALRALGPTTMLQLPGASANAFGAMAELVRRVPCYRLRLGGDVGATPGALTELLTDLGHG